MREAQVIFFDFFDFFEKRHDKGGRACYDFEEIEKIRKVCDEHRLGLHLDGARLFNALVEKKERPEMYGKIFDTISICLSKGLGSPAGSVLIGDEAKMRFGFEKFWAGECGRLVIWPLRACMHSIII